jgi:hypothetical protein
MYKYNDEFPISHTRYPHFSGPPSTLCIISLFLHQCLMQENEKIHLLGRSLKDSVCDQEFGKCMLIALTVVDVEVRDM